MLTEFFKFLSVFVLAIITLGFITAMIARIWFSVKLEYETKFMIRQLEMHKQHFINHIKELKDGKVEAQRH